MVRFIWFIFFLSVQKLIRNKNVCWVQIHSFQIILWLMELKIFNIWEIFYGRMQIHNGIDETGTVQWNAHPTNNLSEFNPLYGEDYVSVALPGQVVCHANAIRRSRVAGVTAVDSLIVGTHSAQLNSLAFNGITPWSCCVSFEMA